MKVICPGSFDPITWGHVDVVLRARDLFGEVILAVGQNSSKTGMFSLDERVALAQEALAGEAGISVVSIDGLLVNVAEQLGADAIVKGLRFATDFDYELQMAHMNLHAGNIETILLPASPEFGTVSSTMMRQIASFGGDVSKFVPPNVNRALLARRPGPSGDGSDEPAR